MGRCFFLLPTLCFLSFTSLFAVSVQAATFTVKTDGSGNYTTIQACANVAQAGDTCLVSPGTYNESITPARSGTSGNRITFRGVSGGAKPVMNGFALAGRNYITIEGFELHGAVAVSYTGASCSWIEVLKNDFVGVNGNNITLRGNDVLISGNTFDRVNGDMVWQNGIRWTIRNNTVIGETDSGDVHMDFWQSFCRPTGPEAVAAAYGLVENNTFINISGGNVHFALVNGTDSCAFPPTNLIFRHNTVKNIGSMGVYIDSNQQAPGSRSNAVYNNTFAELAEGVFTWQDGCCTLNASADSRGINNLFYKAMDASGAVGFYGTTGWAQSHNLYFDPDRTMTFSGAAVSETGAVKNQNPLFVDYANHDLRLSAASPAVGAGGPLTKVAVGDSGAGTLLVVEEAYLFQDGWGGAQADWIAVGSLGNAVQIQSIDYANNVVTLASAVNRQAGDPVWLFKDSSGRQVFYGAAPDIGAYEYFSESPSPPSSSIIDPSRRIDWTQAGVPGGIPARTTRCATLGTAGQAPNFAQNVTAAQINSAIAACASDQTVYLNPGTYTLGSGVTFGSKSNVTLRGAGADQTILVFNGTVGCGLIANICISNDNSDRDSVRHLANWTGTTEGEVGVYPKGASRLTLSSTSGLAVGGLLLLDQLDDTVDGWPAAGDLYVCATGSCTGQGGGASTRPNRNQVHVAEVTAISGNEVTITPALTMPNWRTSQSPQARWPDRVLHDNGIEDLTAQGTAATHCSTCGNIVVFNARNSWIKGVRSVQANTSGGAPLAAHLWLNITKGITVRDNYFYGGDNWSQSYGVEFFGGTSSALIENNIFQHVTGPITVNGPATANVISYNFAIDDHYTANGGSPGWMQPMSIWHEAGQGMELFEGNSGLGFQTDNIHGTHHFGTYFRNHFYGDLWNNPVKFGNTEIVHLWRYSRFFNIIGNVLGRSGYYNNYQNGNATSIFSINGSPDGASPSGTPADPRTQATLMRWGNYDTVNNAARFDPLEVPSGITNFANPVPANQTLPDSLYLGGKPAWFGSTPFPPIGPDVSNGTGPGGRAHRIPAENCWYGPMGGVVGTSGLLSFNAATCYGNTTTIPAAPVIIQQPVDRSVQVGASVTFSISATGIPAPTYQWRVRNPGSSSFTSISGATSSSYIKANAQWSDSGTQYQCVVTNVQGSVTSSNATLTVGSGNGGGTTLEDPNLSGINDRTFTVQDTVEIPPVVGASGFNWELTEAMSNEQRAMSTRKDSSLIARRSSLSRAPIPTSVPRFNLASQLLTPGRYTLRVQATNASQTSNWASASITLVEANLNAVKIYPNPWRADKHTGDIIFSGLSANATVKIFTVSGRLIKKLPAAAGQQTWDLKTDSGDRAASGVYLYVIEDGSGNKRKGKVAVIQ